MAFGDITKNFAKQALGNSAKSVLDSLRPAEVPKLDTAALSEHSSAESVGVTILAELKAMQNALKEDTELVVLVHTGFETLRVLEFYVPSPQVAVLIGIDIEKNVTRYITRIDALKLTCKVMKAQDAGVPVRINFITPKPKPA